MNREHGGLWLRRRSGLRAAYWAPWTTGRDIGRVRRTAVRGGPWTLIRRYKL